MVDPERGGPTAVTITWNDVRSGMGLHSSDTLQFEIVNRTDDEQSVRLRTVASGLDGRLVEHALGETRIPAREQRLMQLGVDAFPIQSVGSPSFVTVMAELDRPSGEPTRIPTQVLYYVFDQGYARATFYDQADVIKAQPKDLFDVRGRIMNDDGSWTDVAGVGPSGLGLTAMRAAPANDRGDVIEPLPQATEQAPTLPATGSKEVAVTAQALTSTVTLCTTWRVQYIDSAFGEDAFATTAWQDVTASFARAWIYNASNAVMWSGNLDANGCVQLPLTNGNYTLWQQTAGTAWNGITFNTNYFIGNNQAVTHQTSSAFTVPNTSTASVTVHPTYNSDAVQGAAVAGQILLQHGLGLFFGLGGMGIVPNSYLIVANQGCGPDITPPTDSCYDPSLQLVHLGTTVIGSTAEPHWKFIIAHETGHYVQDRAMGAHSYRYDDSATQALCKCDHYSTTWGNREHCLQSREIIGGSQLEGFAQAFATRTFNRNEQNDATFVYYKPFLYSNNSVGYPPLRSFPVGYSKWMNTYCPSTGRGTELDWMQFYYQVSMEYSANYTSLPKLFDIYKRTCTGSTSNKCNGQSVSWSALQSNALAYYGGSTSNASYARFRDTGANAGVNF